MRANIPRALVAAASGAVICVAGASGASGPASAARTGPASVSAPGPAHPGSQLWAKRYGGPGKTSDFATGVAVSPPGGTVFVTGSRQGDYGTVAYHAATGGRIWASRYHSPGGGHSTASAIAVSRTSKLVFVTGGSDGVFATVAYNTATGSQIWASRYHGPGSSNGAATAIAVSPTSKLVFVTGGSGGGYLTVAYDTATGAQVWASRYLGLAAESVAVSPDGTTVFVTGYTGRGGRQPNDDYATIAYRAATGTQLWIRRYNDSANGDDVAYALAVSPLGGHVFVTGQSYGRSGWAFLTVAYDAGTGLQLWTRRYAAKSLNQPTSMAISPDGKKLFVTGYATEPGHIAAASSPLMEYVTVAYDTSTGTRLWVKRRPGGAYSVAVSPGGRRVFVTGGISGQDSATVAYDARSGTRLWVSRHTGPATSLAVSPLGGRVFVAGGSPENVAQGSGYITVAYRS